MPTGTGDKDFFVAYRDILPRLVKNFRPDIILVSAGYDILLQDPLSGFKVTSEGMRSIIRGILLRSTATYLPSLPYVFALEGGYNLKALADSVLQTITELLEL
jgi:acetoin utilization deacetylase AcuC-like enzyme